MGSDTREVRVGSVPVGGGAPVSVQTMANVDPHDAAALLRQIESCAALGCDIFRLTVPDVAAAETLGVVRKSSPIPLVADIHFDYRCALAAIANGTDALRLNPGNIGSRDRVQAVARAAKEKGVPIRIGVNLGSLEKDLREKLEQWQAGNFRFQISDCKGRGGDDHVRSPVPELLCESAMRHLKLLEDEGFREVVVSAKASNVADTLATYRLLAERTDCPLHLGVTEAGTLLPGTVRNSVALGILLSEGIGDTIRVSLTDQPEKEVRVGVEILRSLGLKAPGPAITSCPTCGRTKVNLFKVAAEVEEKLEGLYRSKCKNFKLQIADCISSVANHHSPVAGQQSPVASRQSPVAGQQSPVASRQSPVVSRQSPVAGQQSPVASRQSPVAGQQSPVASCQFSTLRFPHVAVMGCVVNGPGEAKGADVALCGGVGEFVLYVHGEPVRKVSESSAAAETAACVESLIRQTPPAPPTISNLQSEI